MRELVFTVGYDRGADPVMDCFIDAPDMVNRTISCHVTSDVMWRLDRVVGPTAGLEALDDVFFDPMRCNECIGATHCHTDWEYELLASDDNSRVIYTYRPENGDCHSIPYLAATHLGDGLIAEAERRANQYQWRILMPDDRRVGDLYDALQAELRAGLELEVKQLTDSTHWDEAAMSLIQLPHEQRVVIEAAVERGYYRTPREITAEELAEALGVPRSTLQYRLRRAEAYLVTCLVGCQDRV